jgi:DNA topoisomerase VI subunit B
MEKIGSIKEIKVDSSRIIQQLSTSTIKDPVDAIVELVTNSDDSYRRLEEKGVKTDGYIGIVITGDRYINNIICVDHAEGMSERELLSKALVYAASSSGFDEKKHVRGLFGRGLKEAIFGLGE